MYQPATYERIVTFFSDSTYRTDLGLCGVGLTSTLGGMGRYSPGKRVIFPINCATDLPVSYRIDGTQLTVTYICTEGCGERYVKVRDV
jgi:hypothetical protein